MKYNILNAYNILFAVLVFFIPLNGKFTAVPNILLIVLAPLFIIIYRQGLFKINQFKTESTLFIILVLFTLLITLFKGNINSDIDLFGRYGLTLLFFTLSFPIVNLKYVKYATIFSCLIMAVYTLLLSGIYVWQNDSFNISVGEEIKDLLITERLYTGFFSAMSFLFSWTFISSLNKRERIFNYFNLFLMLAFVLVISSRIALLIMIAISVYRFSTFSKNKKSFISFFSGLIFIVLMFVLNPNLSNRFFHLDKSKGMVENFKNWEPRLVIWSCAKDLLQNDKYNLLSGYGSETIVNKKLVERYAEMISKKQRRNYFLKKRFNPHNQYFSFLLSYGLISLILYLVIIFYSIKLSNKNFLIGGMILSVFLFGLIESFFERQMGGYIFGLFLIIMTKTQTRTNTFDTQKSIG